MSKKRFTWLKSDLGLQQVWQLFDWGTSSHWSIFKVDDRKELRPYVIQRRIGPDADALVSTQPDRYALLRDAKDAAERYHLGL